MKNLLLIGCAFLGFQALAQSEKGKSFNLDKEYAVSKTGVLDLQCSDANVYITGSVRETAHVKITRNVITKGLVWGDEHFSVDVDERDGNLFIQERSHSSHVGVIGYYDEDYRIEIQVPMGMSLAVRGDDGDYVINYVAGSIKLNLDDADASLRNCNGTSFSFQLDDGDLTMDKAQGELDLRADDADVEIRNAALSKIYADIDDGDLIIQTSLAATGNYQFDAEDGSIVLRITNGGAVFDIRHDDGRVITEGNFTLREKEENRTQLNLADGAAKVHVRCDDGSVRLVAN